ncbi:MAG: hypothetical protein RDV41_10420 [Planctomycetota bacterium]|nr:hypothetical protein [Planctomycetota bacterium]
MFDRLLGIDRGKIGDADYWDFRWGSMPALWLVVLVLVPTIIVLTYLVYRKEGRSASNGMKFFLGALRCLLILLALCIIFEPIIFVEREYPRESTVLVLVDESLSMGLVDPCADSEKKEEIAWATGISRKRGAALSAEQAGTVDSLKRIDIANRILRNDALFEEDGKKMDVLEKLARRFTIKSYTFAAALRPAPSLGHVELKDTSTSTAIGDSLMAAFNATRGHQLVAVVLVSDGCSNVGADPVFVAKLLAEQGKDVPVYTIAPGVPVEPRDIELIGLEAPEAVQARDFAIFDVTLKSTGLDGISVSVFLSEGEREVAEETVTLESGREQRVSLKYKPIRPGEYVCTVSVPVEPGEIVAENNRLSQLLKVVDEKTRVLFVDNFPRWEYRSLKNALIRDDTLDAWCFLQSADPDFSQETSRGLEPLLELPRTAQELYKYDVIIFGDVDPNGPGFSSVPGVAEEIQRNIVSFVEDIGGGFAMIAGKRDSPGRYRVTPMMKILPIVLEDGDYRTFEQAPNRPSFMLQVTPQGRDHPIMKLDSDPVRNLNLWQDPDGNGDGLPGMYWFYPVKRTKSGATALAVHPTEQNKYGHLPIIAVQPCGRGRSLFVSTDETWSWRFVVGDKYFYSFWREAIRFLRGGRLVGGKRFTVKTDKPKYGVGEVVKISARILDPDYKPLEDPSYPAHLSGPQAEHTEIQLKAVAGRPGAYEAEYKPESVGFHKLSVGADLFGEERDSGFASFAVQVPVKEYANPMLDRKTLESIATTTRGAFVELGDIQKLPDLITGRGATFAIEPKEDELWDSPLALLLFAIMITTEWIVRKRARLV